MFRRIFTAAALALSIGMATAPAFAEDFDDAISGLTHSHGAVVAQIPPSVLKAQRAAADAEIAKVDAWRQSNIDREDALLAAGENATTKDNHSAFCGVMAKQVGLAQVRTSNAILNNVGKHNIQWRPGEFRCFPSSDG